jgi:type I restriction enzyme S subunit
MSSENFIGDDWNVLPASEYCLNVADGTHDSPQKTETGKLLVTSKNVVGGSLDLSKSYFISESDFHEINKRSKVDKNDVLLSMIGTVGEPCLITEKPDFAIKNVGLLKNEDPIKAKWLYFYLLSPHGQSLIKERTRGSTQQYIPLGEIRNLPIQFPSDFEKMKSIVDQLSALHDKIHLNQQTNETLESMAQAIFKSWFVDFDPVRAKIEATSAGRDPNRAAMAAIAGISLEQDWDEIEAALDQKLACMSEAQQQQLSRTAELFPDELVESEIGEVPKGWEYDELGNFIAVKRGGSPRPIKDFVVDVGLHWTKISDATSENSPFIMTTKEFIKEEGLKKTVLLEKDSLILSNSATPGLPKFLNIDACIHDGWLYFPEQEHFTDLYLYHLFIEIRKALVAKGSGTVFTNLKTSILRNYDVVVPNEELVKKFTDTAQSIFASLLNNREETDSLTKLRDTLLPKLISGEVGVE